MSVTPEEIEQVDQLPRPSRRGLAFDAVEAACSLAVRSAFEVADPSARARCFRRVVRGMEPASPATMTIDGWARLGAVEGAVDAWENNPVREAPRDAPSPRHLSVFISAYTLARTITALAVQEVRNG